MVKVLAAFEKYSARAGVAEAQRLKAFVLVLRYSGMRIGDTVKCGVGRITRNKLFLYTQKTGVPVHCILPDFVLRELDAAPKSSEGHFFWTGKSKLHSANGSEGFKRCSNWPRFQEVTLTVFGTPSPLSYSSPGFHWSASPCFSGIKV
jgi:hypothetical protein